MKVQCILGTKFVILTTTVCIIILHCAVAQRGACINGECTLEIDACYKDQCYEVVGECNEEKQCEHEDSKCIDATKKKNICIWLKTPADNITVLTSTTAPVTVPTIITAPVTVPTTTTPHDECRDEISNCLHYYFLCNNELYKPLMVSLCKLTCSYCDTPILTTNTPEICQDKAAPNKPSDCPLHSDLCNEPVYAELMKDQCPKTCGYCNPATTTLYTT